jgi:hypothetical protein
MAITIKVGALDITGEVADIRKLLCWDVDAPAKDPLDELIVDDPKPKPKKARAPWGSKKKVKRTKVHLDEPKEAPEASEPDVLPKGVTPEDDDKAKQLIEIIGENGEVKLDEARIALFPDIPYSSGLAKLNKLVAGMDNVKRTGRMLALNA